MQCSVMYCSVVQCSAVAETRFFFSEVTNEIIISVNIIAMLLSFAAQRDDVIQCRAEKTKLNVAVSFDQRVAADIRLLPRASQ